MVTPITVATSMIPSVSAASIVFSSTADAYIANILGYSSAVAFIGARIPQILKNAEKRSCEGLSLGLFVFGMLGNISYSLSVFFHSLDWEYIKGMLPWLCGSLGTLFLDSIILYQFFTYRTRAQSQILRKDIDYEDSDSY
ncbi:hypothetical protein ROZALSC1DRAFT_28230 [Rozella allomycis CSF55]|uniref:PQ-loop-domain-containing protein n=1 Tax=Rozella allomycis (strain CSF55) TaxID=988480 RepID=A0A075AYJ0_ROZAC|nr:hypothetical protein O9G_000354 [Rozella allomycis CSF55]RKP20274.1 hypothetical protein ROZALSC1DRAFT_28230 [Rozella allomycis CSF55]|eukprot:EPZ33579.1 hypothetical protein O9G_000354 [Rozella allomycis CSF55]